MAGPWEKYKASAPAAAAPAAKPWEKFAPGVTAVTQEMHPELSFGDRFKVKNFGSNTEDSIAYLRKQHPDLEFADKAGQIVAKGRGEASWRPLDPAGFDAQDVTDLGYDALAGFGTGLATAAGGIAGNIPGAVGAGAASSGAAEALRQAIGRELGVAPEFSGQDIAIATGAGALSPVFLGSGATAGAAGKAAAKGLAKSEAAEALQKSLGKFTLEGVADTAPTKEAVLAAQRGVSRFLPTASGAATTAAGAADTALGFLGIPSGLKTVLSGLIKAKTTPAGDVVRKAGTAAARVAPTWTMMKERGEK